MSLGEDDNPADPSEPASEPNSKLDRPPEEVPNKSKIVYPRVQREAMGSLFEIYLAGTDRETLVGAGEQALDDIERLDRQLSHYRDDSDVARLNQHAVEHWVRLEPRMYHLLKRCAEISVETDGAFDITLGPLMKAWGFHRGEGRIPADSEIARIMETVGIDRVQFDDDDNLLHFTVPGLEINLGAVGKGYAIDQAVETLKLFGVTTAVLHGGQSTIYAMGEPPIARSDGAMEYWSDGESDAFPPHSINSPASDSSGWRFEIKDPRDKETVMEVVHLNDEALSVSGNYEQFFESDGVRYSHILNPRTGRPTHGMLSVAVIGPNAEETDALSTAFFVMGRERTQEFCRTRSSLRVIIVEERGPDDIEVTRIGFD